MEEKKEIAGGDDHHPPQQEQRLMLSFGVFAKRCVVARRFHRALVRSEARPVPRMPAEVQTAKPQVFATRATAPSLVRHRGDAFSTSQCTDSRNFFWKKLDILRRD